MGPCEAWAPEEFPRTKGQMFSRELSKAWTSKHVKEVVIIVEINRGESNRKQIGWKRGDKGFDSGRGWGKSGGGGEYTNRRQASSVKSSMESERYRREAKQPCGGVGRVPRQRQVKVKGRGPLALDMRHGPDWKKYKVETRPLTPAP